MARDLVRHWRGEVLYLVKTGANKGAAEGDYDAAVSIPSFMALQPNRANPSTNYAASIKLRLDGELAINASIGTMGGNLWRLYAVSNTLRA